MLHCAVQRSRNDGGCSHSFKLGTDFHDFFYLSSHHRVSVSICSSSRAQAQHTHTRANKSCAAHSCVKNNHIKRMHHLYLCTVTFNLAMAVAGSQPSLAHGFVHRVDLFECERALCRCVAHFSYSSMTRARVLPGFVGKTHGEQRMYRQAIRHKSRWSLWCQSSCLQRQMGNSREYTKSVCCLSVTATLTRFAQRKAADDDFA